MKKNFEKFFPLKILEKKIFEKNFEKFFPLKNPLGASGENMNVLSFIFIISKHRCSLDAARPCALRALTSI